MIGTGFSGRVGAGNRGGGGSNEEVMGGFGVLDRNEDGQMVVDLAKRVEMAVGNTFSRGGRRNRVTHLADDVN